MNILSLAEIKAAVTILLKKYHAESALLFGSYARGEATGDSDIDLIVIGGSEFRRVDIFAFSEELRAMTKHDADVFEISEINVGTPIHDAIMKEGVRIA